MRRRGRETASAPAKLRAPEARDAGPRYVF
jgi:hypothetical protein